MGSPVAQVKATDNDDPDEGKNARLVYSLEKNVIDESSGKPIFAVDSQNGVITTALCCLDREKTQRYAIQIVKTQRYAIQVVATDGGGLKGTGTVLVEVSDLNDVSPKFTQRVWSLEVAESLTPDHTLATLTVLDYDVRNNFTFKVVPGRDEGEDGWNDPYHVDGTWVNLQLLDANDNTPTFTHSHAHLTLAEDTPLAPTWCRLR
ncbi:neural-cadherin 2-like 13 [Homarus americanus]|uniref:Neural-cadherin 2-like 13 n=1 Tax=Homarus americanus TaxID=6706 RepID=A0A8J5N5W1_HOMAM|nr:neural-cadherin 2-like 13 [Homarus americanus]